MICGVSTSTARASQSRLTMSNTGWPGADRYSRALSYSFTAYLGSWVEGYGDLTRSATDCGSTS